MWHVVHTAPHSELRVCRYLDVQGLPTYAPEFERRRGTHPGSVRDSRHQWIFPGYVFFRAPEGFIDWHVVRRAPGVRQLLQYDGRPAFMDDAVIDEIQGRIAWTRAPHPGAAFRTGQRVVIDRGPLAMVDALFDRCLPAPDRVRILVHLLGRQVSVDVDPTILRAAS
jgi:transcription antitermination factor NusG